MVDKSRALGSSNGMHGDAQSSQRAMITLTAWLVALCACAPGIELASRSAAVPAGIDLTGRWQLQDESESANQRIDRANGKLVHVFLETGALLKTTQTDSGLFISFDRSIVEEYRFGENREIRIGPIAAQRVSGWQDRRYVIETLDDDGVILRETYWLSGGGLVLNRSVVVEKSSQQRIVAEVAFDRIDDRP